MCLGCKENSVYWDAFDQIMTTDTGNRSDLIPLLQKLQQNYGYLPEDVIERLSTHTGISIAEIMGVITFYSQFRLTPVGKHVIKICFGTACHVIGAQNIADAICHELNVSLGGTTDDGLFTVESVACIGCCSLAPVITIDDETHGRLTPDSARSAVRQFQQKEGDR